MRSAEISVIVATRERPERLEQCIRGVLDGEVLPAEIVVVDQSPAPPPVGIAADRVQLVVVRDGGRGLSRARNLALRAARNPVVAVLDDDCVPSPGWLSAIDRELGDGSVDAVAGPVLPLPPEGSERHAVSSRRSLEPRTYTGTAAPWRVGTGGNFAVRSARLRELGGYDERLGAGTAAMAGEDLDLIHRLLRGGARIAYVPAALVYHSRADATRRRATRSGYGRGAGTFIGLRLRARDASAAAVLGRWIVDRAALLGRAVVRADSNAAVEELLVLGGTAAGLADGLRGAR